MVQHQLLHCNAGLDACKHPSVSELRIDLLDAAEDRIACVAAVQSAFGLLVEGGSRGLRTSGVCRRSESCT